MDESGPGVSDARGTRNRNRQWFWAYEFQLIDSDFQGKAPMNRGERNDDLAFPAHFGNDAQDTVEDAAPHPHVRPDFQPGVRPQQITAGQPKANPFKLVSAYRVASRSAAQKMKNAGNGNDR